MPQTSRRSGQRDGIRLDPAEGGDLDGFGQISRTRRGHQQDAVGAAPHRQPASDVEPQQNGQRVGDDDPLTGTHLVELGQQEFGPCREVRPIGLGKLWIQDLLTARPQSLDQFELPMSSWPSVLPAVQDEEASVRCHPSIVQGS